MTEPPFWITNTPGAPGIHNTPAPSYEAQAAAQDQQTAMWNKLLESVWQQFLLWVQGVLFPGPAGQQITDWANQILNGIIEVFAGANSTLDDVVTWVNNLFGNIAALQTAVARLQSAGMTVVDFSTLPDTTNLPSSFTESYFGSGTNPYGVSGGLACEGGGDNQARAMSAIYNVAGTATDTQIVVGVWANGPVSDGFGLRGYCSLNGRINGAGTSSVYVEFGADSAELGCYVSGTKTVFATVGNGGSGSFAFKQGAAYSLCCGTPGGAGDRVFTVKENEAAIISYTDGGVSQVGASYRACGASARWPASFGNVRPGRMAVFAFDDN